MIFERVFRWVIRISFIISIVLYCLGIFSIPDYQLKFRSNLDLTEA